MVIQAKKHQQAQAEKLKQQMKDGRITVDDAETADAAAAGGE